MCGITGFVGTSVSADVLDRMTRSIIHRGPDAGATWLDSEAGVGLGHRRLSILDLSEAGNQPMASADGRYVMVFNGEIYNHLDLRKKLDRSDRTLRWRGHSDTETLLQGFVDLGVEQTLREAVGMFALALWDRRDRVLTLARDRMGEKPLYYGWQHGSFLFGSELKALRAHPHFDAPVDRNALALLLRHNCVPAPNSIYQDIFKLLPGHWVAIPFASIVPGLAITSAPYWKYNDAVASGLAEGFAGSDQEAVDALEAQLSLSIRGQMLADVPVGAFLSGGIDSSTIVALMQAQSTRPVRTFTIGFQDQAYDEAPYAKAVAAHLGTEHTELYVTHQDALAVVPNLARIYCEPFSDSSQIPACLVSRMASRHVKVALSGDAGDELFGGYNRYLMARRVWGRMRRFPPIVRLAAASALRGLRPSSWDRLYGLAGAFLPSKWRLRTPGDKAHKLAGVLALRDEAAFYRQLVSHWDEPESVALHSREPATLLTRSEDWPGTDCFEHWMMAMDAQTYLGDDILVKMDRAAMAYGLESRVPMLDHRVIELAWRMPMRMKIRDGQGKWLLRQVLFRHVPQALIERPKMGFGVPLHEWLRGPLRDWAEDLLDENRLRTEGFFRPEPIRALWKEHLSGRQNAQHPLWDVLMFQAWLQESRSS